MVIKINPNMAVDFESKKIDMLMPKLMNIKKLFLENNPCNLKAFIEEKPVVRFKNAQANPKYFKGISMLLK